MCSIRCVFSQCLPAKCTNSAQFANAANGLRFLMFGYQLGTSLVPAWYLPVLLSTGAPTARCTVDERTDKVGITETFLERKNNFLGI